MKSFPILEMLILFGLIIVFNSQTEAQRHVVFQQGKTDKMFNETLLNILFIDSASNHSDTFNIIRKNPYNTLPYRSVGTIQGNAIYKLSLNDVNDLISKETRKMYFSPYDEPTLNGDSVEGYSSISKNNDEESFVVLCYIFKIRDSRAPGKVSSMYIIDNEGKVLNVIRNIPCGAYNPSISQNGKYISVVCGVSFEGINLMPVTYRIYEVATGRLVFCETPNGQFGIPYSVGNLLINTSDLNRFERELYIYNAVNSNLYKKVLPRSIFPYIKTINQDGFIFKEPGKDAQLLLLDKDFEKQEVK